MWLIVSALATSCSSPQKERKPTRRMGEKGSKSKSLASTAVLQLSSGLCWRQQEPTWAKSSQIYVLWGESTHTHAHTQRCYSEQSTTSSSLAPRLRLLWRIRAMRLAARGWFPLGSVPMAYEAARVPGGPSPACPFRGEGGGKMKNFGRG